MNFIEQNQNLLESFIFNIFKIIFIIFIAYFIYKALCAFIKKSVFHYSDRLGNSENKEETAQRNATLEGVIFSTLKMFIIVFTFVLILFEIGILKTAPFAALAGFLGIAVGFGGQFLVRDLISGFFVITEDQFKKGDKVTINDVYGIVEDVSLRRTVIRDNNNQRFYIPNGEIKIVSNSSKLTYNLSLEIKISNKENADYVFDVLNRLGKQMAEEGSFTDSFLKPFTALGIEGLKGDGFLVRAAGETKLENQDEIVREYRRMIKKEFDKLGVEVK